MPIPKIRVALNGKETLITLVKITQSIVDYEAVDSKTSISFKGVVQPLNPQELKASELGIRAWQSWIIHTRIEQELNTNDQVIYEDQEYRVVAFNDWKLNNYYEYHLIKSYE